MTNNSHIAKWTALRHFIPAAFTGKPITGAGYVLGRVEIARFLVYSFLRCLFPRYTCIFEIKLLLLSGNHRMKEMIIQCAPAVSLHTLQRSFLTHPRRDPYPQENPFQRKRFYSTAHL